jgi:cation diffusion facilitator CzcD-associated flavoprotein CzcO
VYQRSAPWVFPRHDRPIGRTESRLYRRFPLALRLRRWKRFWDNDRVAYAFEKQTAEVDRQRRMALAFLDRSIADRALREAVTPDYSVGCKRRVMSDDWYPTLQRENVQLIAGALTEVRPRSVLGADGVERPVDTIIFSTGFAVTDFLPMKVFGVGGVELHETWSEGAQTHLGITVSGYPNLFLISGPNTAIGAGSFAFMIECQVRYLTRAIELMRRQGIATVEVRREVQRRSYWRTQSRLAGSVYGSGCVGWYQSPNGHIDTLWPGANAEYWWRTRRFDQDNYRIDTIGRAGHDRSSYLGGN